MTMARMKAFCRAKNINFGYCDGIGVFPRRVIEKNKAINVYNSHFCLTWKSRGSSFNKAIEELETNFKMTDNIITEENVNSHFKYAFIP